MYSVCPHVAVPEGDLPGLEIETRAQGIRNLPLGRLRHLAECLPSEDHLKRSVVSLLAERTIHQVSKYKPRPLSDDDIEEHYSKVFKEFGLERRKV